MTTALLTVVAALALTCSSAQSGPAAEPAVLPAPAIEVPDAGLQIREIRPGVWLHTSYYTYPGGSRFPANGLLVRDGDGLLLVDTAWGELATVALLGRVAAEIGLPIRRAIVTHFHYDRLAGVDVLEERGVEVLAHPKTRELAISLGIPVPDRALDELAQPGGAVQLGAAEVFYPGPGHAEENLVVWLEDTRVLFGGCAVRAAASGSLGNTDSADLERWPDSIRRVAERYPQAEVVVPGHGDVGGGELLAHTLHLFSSLRESGPVELSLLQGGTKFDLAAETRTRLATRTVAFFETCHTYEAVTGERPVAEEVREIWDAQIRGLHLAVAMPVDDGSGEARQVVLGFTSGAGAGPVLSRDVDGVLEIYSKCDGLAGLLLACDVRDAVPGGAGADDCKRLRAMAQAPPPPQR